MAKWKVLKPITLKSEGKELVKGDEIELTVKRKEEIETAVDQNPQFPNYTPIFERLDDK